MALSPNFQCPQCNKQHTLFEPSLTKVFVCGNCNSALKEMGGTWQKNDTLPAKSHLVHPVIALGHKGVLDGVEYTVIAQAIRHERLTFYYWVEYSLLRTSDKATLFLSCYNGHWMLLEEIVGDAALSGARRSMEFEYRGVRFTDFHSYEAVYDYANGEFHWKMHPGAHISCQEHIAPPYLVAFEQQDVFVGRYLSPKEVKQAFEIPRDKMPARIGVGAAQPFYFNLDVTRFAIGAVVFCVLAIFIQAFTNRQASPQTLFTDRIVVDTGATQIVSNSFTITGTHPTGLEVNVFADVTNSWAEADFTMVNEKTRQETDFSVGAEYYSGVEDGEAWSEGNRQQTARLCSIVPGTYHFVVTPSKDVAAPLTNMDIEVVSNVPWSWNAVFLCFTMAILTALVALGNYIFNSVRGQ